MPEAPHEQPWPMSVVVQLGKQLAEVLVRAAQMPSSLAAPRSPGTLIPVLYHVYSFRSFRQVGHCGDGRARRPWALGGAGPLGHGGILPELCCGLRPGLRVRASEGTPGPSSTAFGAAP